MVSNAIRTVERNLMEGALIVVFVLVFFLGNLRAGLIVSSVIPLAMLFAIILMNLTGIGGNLMSLGAIDFGLIVDGSVIVVEAILHRLAHSRHFAGLSRVSQEEMDGEVGKSTGLTINSAVFSQIIILIVYLPILSLQGIEGKMFKPMAYTIAYAILGAFLMSVTYVPMMSALFLNKKLGHKPTLADRVMIVLQRRYMPALLRVLRYPGTVIATTLGLFALAVFLLLGMGGEFIPQIEEGDFAVETRLLTGSNLSNTIDYTQKASKILLGKFPEVEKVVTKIGSAEIPTDPMPLEAGDMMVILKDKSRWTSAKSFKELSEKMTQELAVIPGIAVGFQFPVQMRFNELMTGARQDVVCKIFGENLDSLASFAHQLNRIVQTVPGAIDIYEETVTGMPQVVVRYNREAMAAFGLNVQDVNRVINTAFAGQVAGQVYEGERRFDLTVRLAGEARRSLGDIQDLLIPTRAGQQIPLSQVARIEEEEGVNQIQRENTQRRIVLGFNVAGRDVQTIVRELQQKVSEGLHLPPGYRLVYGGSFENMNAAKERLSIVVPVALLMIFLLLYFAFRSVKQGLLIYTAIPLSAIGGVLALRLRGMPFSISAGVGFIALFGVAVLNGILLVAEFNRLRKEGWRDLPRIVTHASKSKLRAVLMTALVPSLGFIPMAVSTGAGGEVQKPLATVVIGGLIVSTMLTLFVLPLLYILLEKGALNFRRPKRAAALAAAALLFTGPGPAKAQISLDSALSMAQRKNAGLAAARLSSRYYRTLTATAADIPKTRIGVDYGKLNSLFDDNRLSVSQSLEFPVIYARQRQVYQAQAARSQAQAELRMSDLLAEVKTVYYGLVVMREKERILVAADSIYLEFLRKTEARFRQGDVDALERSTAENQRLQIAAQLLQLRAEEAAYRRRLQYLLNSGEELSPGGSGIRYPATTPGSVANAPALSLQHMEAALSRRQLRLERSRLLPTIDLSYGTTTIIGWQTTAPGTDAYFGRSRRFGSFGAGLSIPVFRGAQQARIRAADIAVQQAEKEREAMLGLLQAELEAALIRRTQLLSLLESYELRLLPNAASIIGKAGLRLEKGEIDYLQWALLINQSFALRSSYFDEVQRLNETEFEIERITGSNLK